eukprot:GHVR01074189.1.p1 GENE.GHVR01074189.1~~GHVR01074189.1.p1  ORF type:complete len:205 (+),score=89.37 GHVR01074189.1:145-759(+)
MDGGVRLLDETSHQLLSQRYRRDDSKEGRGGVAILIVCVCVCLIISFVHLKGWVEGQVGEMRRAHTHMLSFVNSNTSIMGTKHIHTLQIINWSDKRDKLVVMPHMDLGPFPGWQFELKFNTHTRDNSHLVATSLTPSPLSVSIGVIDNNGNNMCIQDTHTHTHKCVLSRVYLDENAKQNNNTVVLKLTSDVTHTHAHIPPIILH